MTGYRTYRLEGCRIHATPWLMGYMDEQTVHFMVADMLIARIDEVTLSAESVRGPFLARLLDFRGHGITPLAALRDAIDQQQRMVRARTRALP